MSDYHRADVVGVLGGDADDEVLCRLAVEGDLGVGPHIFLTEAEETASLIKALGMVAHPEVVSVGEFDVAVGLITPVRFGRTTPKDYDHTLGEGGETLVDAVTDAGAQPVEEDEEKHPEEDPQ